MKIITLEEHQNRKNHLTIASEPICRRNSYHMTLCGLNIYSREKFSSVKEKNTCLSCKKLAVKKRKIMRDGK